METEKLLQERSTTHGAFEVYAAVAQGLKYTLAAGPKWNCMSPAQQEAVEAIAGKLARIVTGDPYFLDHYRDIAGYAERALENTSHHENAIDVRTEKFKVNEAKSGK